MSCGLRALVHESLSFGGANGRNRPLSIVHIASVPHKVKLPQVTMQIFFAHAVVDSHDAALQKREGTLCRVRMDVAANILFRAVADRLVPASEFPADAVVSREVIRHDARLL